MEKGPGTQGMQAASRSWKGRKQMLPGASKRNQHC